MSDQAAEARGSDRFNEFLNRGDGRLTWQGTDSVLARANSGRGPVARLLNDSTVMQNLLSTNEALRALLTDFRENPKRYIHVSVF